MPATRLSALDASFLAVETPTAHMHVGWAAVFEPPEDSRPSFEELRHHIGARLPRAPRYRQMLRGVPLGLNAPVWVDDPGFELARHVLPVRTTRFGEAVDQATLLVDSKPDPSEPEPDRWSPRSAPRDRELVVGAVLDRLRAELRLA